MSCISPRVTDYWQTKEKKKWTRKIRVNGHCERSLNVLDFVENIPLPQIVCSFIFYFSFPLDMNGEYIQHTLAEKNVKKR